MKEAGHDTDTIIVNGAWEFPIIMNKLINTNKYSGFIVVGAIIGGKTTPYASRMSTIVRTQMINLATQHNTFLTQGIIEGETQEEIMEITLRKGRINEGGFAAQAMVDLLKLEL